MIVPPIKISIWICLAVIILLAITHLPFLSADADIQTASVSRGSWTDEGLNTCQIRNYINHGKFDILECDNFLKTPLFSISLYLPLKITGTTLQTARIFVIAVVMIMLVVLLFHSDLRIISIALAASTMLFFPIHQHTHLALAEMCAIAMAVISGVFFVHSFIKNKRINLIFSFVFLLLATLYKLQFVYFLAIPPLSILLNNVFSGNRIFNKQFLISMLLTGGFSVVIFIGWYIPFQNEFEIITAQQSWSFSHHKLSYTLVKSNLIYFLFAKEYIMFTICFALAFTISAWNLLTRNITGAYRYLLLFSIAWFILELHKLNMMYLPMRYMISFYFSMGLIIAISFSHIFETGTKPVIKIIVSVAILFLTAFNIYDYKITLNKRTYQISEINKYLAAHHLQNETIIGPWAPALTWESKSRAIPVWKDFLRTNNPIKLHQPAIVISEPDEEDSENAYESLGIHLSFISDSIVPVKVANWNINIYWLKLKPESIMRNEP